MEISQYHQINLSTINELDNIFISEFPIISVKKNIGKELRNEVDNVPFDHPCSDFDIDFLKNYILD